MESKLCKCGQPRRPGQRNCLDCHANSMRRNRPRHSELGELAHKKANSRSYANVYKRRGKLIPKPCEECGSQDTQMHHLDYDFPLEVVWLCESCHHLRHAA